MNHNNNNNEYEIIDLHTSSYPSNRNSNHSRYPYTNNPNQLLQNTNYKDWLNMCQQNQQYGKNFEITPTALKDAVVTAINVNGAIFVAIPTPVTVVIGTGLILLGSLLSFLWPPEETGGEAQPVWQEFIRNIEEHLKRSIDQQVRSYAINTLKGIDNNIKLYSKSFRTWFNDQNDKSALDNLTKNFSELDNLFEASMPHFASDKHEILLLSIYAQAANLHLLLLRDMLIYGEKWGY
ncbi:hypothetical protein ILT06_31160 [Bacillus sp. 17RED48]|nr:hypothetical protein [Bacillus sp. 17RED48]